MYVGEQLVLYQLVHKIYIISHILINNSNMCILVHLIGLL